MLLAIDVGNTNAKFALFDGAELLARWRIATDDRRTADEYMVWLDQLLRIEGHDRGQVDAVIISTVSRPASGPHKGSLPCRMQSRRSRTTA